MINKFIIILHGWKVPPDRYIGLRGLLKKRGYNVYAPDFPGVGNSSAPDRPYTLDDYVIFLEKYIEKQKLNKLILIGHSFGGRVGIRYTYKHPEKVEMLYLTGTPGLVPVGSAKIKLFLIISKTGKAIFSLPVLSAISVPVRKLLYKLSGATDYSRLAGVMKETFKLVIRDSLIDNMAHITVPVKLVWGGNDTVVPVSIARQMQRIIPGSKLAVIPGATHKAPYDDTVQFINALNITS
jgi:pimeloyl-ACP methyl ester carboxylesterase